MTEAQLTAIAGEHYVAHKISMLGLVPTLVRQRMPMTDLLVCSPNGERTIGIQIRCAANATREPTGDGDAVGTYILRFPLGHRAITASTEGSFFCFVDLRRSSPSAPPDVYIVPAATLKHEYEGVYRRRYSQLHYERTWQDMQPYRNNWDPIEKALAPTTASDFAPMRHLTGFARQLRDELGLGSAPATAG